LITGKRAVVYVRQPDTPTPTFVGREIVLGPRAGDYYIVRSGLKEGELVVTNGNFKIDSMLQIQAKPSMMNPEAGPCLRISTPDLQPSTPPDNPGRAE
jgi:Cu(I)/Ag(I) efflux system membrane fusion protein